MANRVYNKESLTVEELIHVTFVDKRLGIEMSELEEYLARLNLSKEDDDDAKIELFLGKSVEISKKLQKS